MGSLLCISDVSVWWRKWLGNLALLVTKSIVAWGALSFFRIRTLKQGIFLASWKRPTGSRENCSSKGRFSYCSRSHSKYTFHEGCLSEQGDEEQQPPTEQNKNSEQQDPLKLPWSHIKMKKPLLKGTRWSKMMLL